MRRSNAPVTFQRLGMRYGNEQTSSLPVVRATQSASCLLEHVAADEVFARVWSIQTLVDPMGGMPTSSFRQWICACCSQQAEIGRVPVRACLGLQSAITSTFSQPLNSGLLSLSSRIKVFLATPPR
jgi:hypothetical protein